MSATRIGLEQLARLRRGDVSIAAKELTIKGAADSEQVAKDIRSVLSTDLPPGFKGTDAITVMTADEKAADSCQSLMRQTTAKGMINFERAKADLTADSTQTLKDLVEIANECPAFSIQIEGHTDAEGTDERNQKLSDRRAQAVADFLARNGVDAKRLTTVGYGATRPLADNDDGGGTGQKSPHRIYRQGQLRSALSVGDQANGLLVLETHLVDCAGLRARHLHRLDFVQRREKVVRLVETNFTERLRAGRMWGHL